MNIFKAPSSAFENQLIKHYFSQACFVFSGSRLKSCHFFQLLYSDNHSIYISEERRKAGMGTVENICVGPKYIFIYSLVYSFIQLFINVRKSEGRNRAVG